MNNEGVGRNVNAEICYGDVEVKMIIEALRIAVTVGETEVIACRMVCQFVGSSEEAPRFTRNKDAAASTKSAAI